MFDRSRPSDGLERRRDAESNASVNKRSIASGNNWPVWPSRPALGDVAPFLDSILRADRTWTRRDSRRTKVRMTSAAPSGHSRFLCLQAGTHLFYELAKSWRSSTRPRNPDLDRGLPCPPLRPASSIPIFRFPWSRARARHTATPILSALLSPRRECRSFSPSGTILTSHRTHTTTHRHHYHSRTATPTEIPVDFRDFVTLGPSARDTFSPQSLDPRDLQIERSGRRSISSILLPASFSLRIRTIGKEHTVPVIQAHFTRAILSEFVGEKTGRGAAPFESGEISASLGILRRRRVYAAASRDRVPD